MESIDRLTQLEAQIKSQVEMYKALEAEKTALDQMLVESLKSSLDSKKNLLMRDAVVNDITNQIQGMFKEKEELLKEIECLKAANENLKIDKQHLENSLSCLQSKVDLIEETPPVSELIAI